MIKGFHCPQGKGDLPFDECLRCAVSHNNPCQFDYPILSAMCSNLRMEESVSVSTLLNCLRKVVLQNRYDVYLDPTQLYYAFRGQLFHTVVAEAQAADAVTEKEFKRIVAGIPLTGHPDVIYPRHRKLVDYKSTKRIPKNGDPYGNHGMQVNLYRFLVAPRYRIDTLEIVYFDMSDVKRVPVEVMDTQDLMKWLVPRVTQLKTALSGGKLPPKAHSDGLWQCNGYCSFTSYCWPDGVPKRTRPAKKEEAKAAAASGRR